MKREKFCCIFATYIIKVNNVFIAVHINANKNYKNLF